MDDVTAAEELPRSGILIVSVNFSDFKSTNTNDARRRLMEELPEQTAKAGSRARLTPLRFGILRSITDDGVTRGSGVAWQFGYTGLDGQTFTAIVNHLTAMKARFKWWSSVDVIVGRMVKEIE